MSWATNQHSQKIKSTVDPARKHKEEIPWENQ